MARMRAARGHFPRVKPRCCLTAARLGCFCFGLLTPLFPHPPAFAQTLTPHFTSGMAFVTLHL